MDVLLLALRSMDGRTFEDLCFHLVKERHPTIDIKRVEGSSGDQGLDLFSGELDGRPTVWQCKSFLHVGESQKGQIRNSLSTALANFTPRAWILCVSVDMDSKTLRWFERWKASHAAKVTIGLFSASDIVHELLHRSTIRKRYFPAVELDPDELKRIVKGTGELKIEEIEKLTESNLGDYLERLKERDARFNYQVVFDNDLGPSSPRFMQPPGALMSFHKGSKTINVFPRDHDALQKNPVTFKVTFKNSGNQKSEEFLRTGIPQEFSADEIESFTSDTPLLSLLSGSFIPGSRISVGPSRELTRRKREVRVSFIGQNGIRVEYQLMTVSPTRIGTDEAECKCAGDGLPFEILLQTPPPQLLRVSQGGVTNFTISYQGAVGVEVRKLKKFYDALALLSPSGKIEIVDLKSEAVFFELELSIKANAFGRQSRYELVSTLARIASRFNVELPFPSTYSKQDKEIVELLSAYIESGTFESENITAVVVKSVDNEGMMRDALASGEGHFRFAFSRVEPRPILFGAEIDTGPCALEFQANIADLDETVKKFEAAAIGDGIEVTFKPSTPVSLKVISEGELAASVR